MTRADRRPSPRERGYTWRWEKYIRPSYLRRHPLCARCYSRGILTAATQVHHKVELANGGTHDDDNLEGLCHPCHSRHTARTRPWGNRQPSGKPHGCDEHGIPLGDHPWRRGD